MLKKKIRPPEIFLCQILLREVSKLHLETSLRRIWHKKISGGRNFFFYAAPQLLFIFWKKGQLRPAVTRPSRLPTPLCHTYSESSGRALSHGTTQYMTYLFNCDGDAIPQPQKTVILRVQSWDYIVKSAIFKVWVISATSMHEIILHAIDMHKNRFKTNF